MVRHRVGSNEHHVPFSTWYMRHLAGVENLTPQAALDSGRFLYNGTVLKDAKTVLAAGDVLVDLQANPAPARRSDLAILYEDEDLLVVDKPAGMLSHREPGMTEPDVIGALSRIRDTAGLAPGNRLDFNTAGLMVVTRSPEAARRLSAATAADRLRKTYLAAVSGYLASPEATLRAFLLQDEKSAIVRVSEVPVPGAREIATAYRVVLERAGLSLLEVTPISGRTHQIRAHMAFVGHPVVGDPLYGNPAVNRRYGRKIQALASWRLAFSFPEPDHPWHKLDGLVLMKKDIDFIDALNLRRP